LRDYPRRSYLWAGEPPQDVGKNGELAIAALLASRKKEKTDSYYIEQQVAKWLRKLGLIDDFQLYELVPNQQYEVRVKCTKDASEVLITDVGFGVSQILPVLVLCYYAPPGSILIFEQPEIHLHPSVQSGLSDVFIDVIKNRNMQIIIESHSEHLLRRLQRRIAEEQINKEDTALYFCQLDNEGNSQLNSLQLDEFGNINNWPTNFFGDEMGDLIAMTEAAIKRQQKS
jgi:predicted ATPase